MNFKTIVLVSGELVLVGRAGRANGGRNGAGMYDSLMSLVSLPTLRRASLGHPVGTSRGEGIHRRIRKKIQVQILVTDPPRERPTGAAVVYRNCDIRMQDSTPPENSHFQDHLYDP